MAEKPNHCENNAENNGYQNGASLVRVQLVVLRINIILCNEIESIPASLTVCDIAAVNLRAPGCKADAGNRRRAARRGRTIHHVLKPHLWAATHWADPL